MLQFFVDRRRRLRALWAAVLTAITVSTLIVSTASAGVAKTLSWGLDRIDQKALQLDSKYSHRYAGAGIDVYVLSSGLRLTSGEFLFNSRARAGGDFTWGDGWGDRDCEGRGTHVASTAGGTTWGVANEVSIISVKIYQCGAGGELSRGLTGRQVQWVVDNHTAGKSAVAVLDMAVDRSTVSDSDMTAYDDMATAMINDGITVVVPAGDKADLASCDQSPARVPAAITVAASTSTDARASSSSTGSCIDVFAPGVDVRTGRHDDDLASTLASGTSMAAAHVAGAAALLLEQHPSYTPAQVWDAMKADATTGVMKSLKTGEPDRLLHVTPAALPGAPTALTGAVAPTDGMPSGYVRLSWSLPADDGGAEITDYVVQDSTDGVTWANRSDGKDTIQAYQTGGFPTGVPRWFRVAAVNAVGQGPWSTSVKLTPLGVPGDVTELTAAVAPSAGVGAGQVKLTWSAPADNGGADVSDYVVEYRPLADLTWRTANDGISTATSFTVDGLTKGVRYTFRVSAKNVVGVGSQTTVGATPSGSPDAPVDLSAAVAPVTGVGSGQIKLTWTAPASNGVAIDDYIITEGNGIWPARVISDGQSTATTFTIGQLTNGQRYTFSVWAHNSLGMGFPAVVSATPMWNPEAPAGLRARVAPADGVGRGEVRLIWNTPSGSAVSDYLIERSEDGVNWSTVDDGISTDTAFTVRGLNDGTRYRFQVTAKNAVGSGPPSAEVSAIPRWTPSAPDGLAAAVAPAADAGSGEVSLTWNTPPANGAAVSDYLIESSSDGTTWTAIDDGVSTETGYTVGDLANGATYSFRVTAHNEVGDGPPSEPIRATPMWMPAAPADLTATRGGSGEVMLAWTAPAANGSAITDYAIESSGDGVTWTTVDHAASAGTAVTVGGLTNGSPYSFRVAALNGVGQGLWSDQVAATPTGTPAVPGGLSAAVAPVAGVRSGQVKLTWTAPSDNGSAISDYLIEQSVDGTTWTTVPDGVSTSTTSSVAGLTNGSQYWFRVAATNAVGRSEWSTITSGTPTWKPAAPGLLRASVARSARVKLTWTTPTTNGAPIADYVIQRSAGKRWTTVRDGVSTTRSYTVTRLDNGTSYRFRVAAKNAVGRGSWSVVVSATPHAR